MSSAILKVPPGGAAAGSTTTVAKKLPMIAQWRNAVCARTSTLTSTQRLVALAMALYSDPDGTRCHPSTESLAAATALTTRSVGSALTGIERAGFATRQMMKGRGQSWRWTLWTLCIPEGAEPSSLPRRKGAETGSTPLREGEETGDTKVRKLVPKGVEPRSSDLERAPRKSHLEEKAISRSAAGRHDERFDELWLIYPRKQGSKEKARKSWVRQKLDPIADQIIAAVTKRKQGDPVWQEPRFIPHPLTYINNQRWLDEWAPASRKPSARDSFVGKTYVRTPTDKLPAEFRAAAMELEAAEAAAAQERS